MSDAAPRGYSLADDIKATYLGHVKVPEAVRGPLDGNAIVEAAAASFDPNTRHAAALAYAGVKPTAGPNPMTREEKLEGLKELQVKHYGDRLDEVPSLQWVGELPNSKYELVLDARAELNPPPPVEPQDETSYDDEDADGFYYDPNEEAY